MLYLLASFWLHLVSPPSLLLQQLTFLLVSLSHCVAVVSIEPSLQADSTAGAVAEKDDSKKGWGLFNVFPVCMSKSYAKKDKRGERSELEAVK
jgi:hypothetical protein